MGIVDILEMMKDFHRRTCLQPNLVLLSVDDACTLTRERPWTPMLPDPKGNCTDTLFGMRIVYIYKGETSLAYELPRG